MSNIVDLYIENNFIPLVNSLDANQEVTSKISIDIHNRLSSILYRWRDEEYRNTLLMHGIEEATYYQPGSNIGVNSLVVVGIRNSLLEDAASTLLAARGLGLTKPIISDLQVRVITSDAISFLSKYDLNIKAQEVGKPQEDPFEELPFKYPLAWEVMNYLSKCKTYVNFQKDKKHSISHLNCETNNDKNIEIENQSGMDSKIGPSLNEILETVKSGEQSFFFTDSFKAISRNPEKLYKVIETVLNADAPFVTINYYLSNGYVSRRPSLLKPFHDAREIESKLKNTEGLKANHRKILKQLV
ncbi:hypothetical protein [Paenibacillus sp. Leaf72]|uniref:hypothetical protein n=1 Tax=Paenibacillus sp. Leaf72 TaxID=1736234 RepID=UPI0006F4DE42|nr:hypothetical protein [Paenibacillus sp. Leaf72]KQO18304.1 hypothetical protein ASF12_06680 [Paenibacillus sp. Leaf72]